MNTNYHPRSAIQKLIFPSLLLLFLAACNPKNDTGTSTTSNSATSTDVTPADQKGQPTQIMGLLGTHLDTLTLDSANYKNLRGKFPPTILRRSKLVVQFYFNSGSPRNPSLIAYAAQPGNIYRSAAVPAPFSVVLNHAGEAFQLPAEFVLGDQQIRFEEIDAIIGSETDFTLYFIPRIKPAEKNVSYKICIRKKNGPIVCLSPAPETQPSPPANTN